jgi:serine phosphatase RsbU (regulator of sigma subunit)
MKRSFMDTIRFAGQYLERLKRVIDAFDMAGFAHIAAEFLSAYDRQAHIFVMGNGGSGPPPLIWPAISTKVAASIWIASLR